MTLLALKKGLGTPATCLGQGLEALGWGPQPWQSRRALSLPGQGRETEPEQSGLLVPSAS